MTHHDNEATIYLAGLSPAALRGTQRFLCFSIANRWSARFRCAVVSRDELCEELGIGERQFGRICQALQLKKIIEYMPGRGQGNYSQFRFPGIEAKATETGHKGDTNASERRHKGDISDRAIRKENLNQNQYQLQDGLGSDVALSPAMVDRVLPASSSEELQDDDTGTISQIVQAFESNPITSGKASASDRATARLLLKNFTVEQIKFGILLGSARKAQSISTNLSGDPLGAAGDISGKVQSLKYFWEAIEEAAQIKLNNTAEYARYLERAIQRAVPKKAPARVSA